MQTNSQPGADNNPVSKNLHQLVGMAAGNSLPTAVQRNSFIVNEVSRDFEISTDEKMLSDVLNTLLSTVVNHSRHSCIRIKAKEYDDVIFVYVKDNSGSSDYTQAENLKHVQDLARQINGSVIVRNMEDKFTTILLSFPNLPKVA